MPGPHAIESQAQRLYNSYKAEQKALDASSQKLGDRQAWLASRSPLLLSPLMLLRNTPFDITGIRSLEKRVSEHEKSAKSMRNYLEECLSHKAGVYQATGVTHKIPTALDNESGFIRLDFAVEIGGDTFQVSRDATKVEIFPTHKSELFVFIPGDEKYMPGLLIPESWSYLYYLHVDSMGCHYAPRVSGPALISHGIMGAKANQGLDNAQTNEMRDIQVRTSTLFGLTEHEYITGLNRQQSSKSPFRY